MFVSRIGMTEPRRIVWAAKVGGIALVRPPTPPEAVEEPSAVRWRDSIS